MFVHTQELLAGLSAEKLCFEEEKPTCPLLAIWQRLWVILTKNDKCPSQSESTSYAVGSAWLSLLCTYRLRLDPAGWTYSPGRSSRSVRLRALPYCPPGYSTFYSAVRGANRACCGCNIYPAAAGPPQALLDIFSLHSASTCGRCLRLTQQRQTQKHRIYGGAYAKAQP
jgi:hypothetical protein